MNNTTYTRPSDPSAARIARKLKKRGIDPAKIQATTPAHIPTAKEIPS